MNAISFRVQAPSPTSTSMQTGKLLSRCENGKYGKRYGGEVKERHRDAILVTGRHFSDAPAAKIVIAVARFKRSPQWVFQRALASAADCLRWTCSSTWST